MVENQCGSLSVGFRSQLIWVYTVFKTVYIILKKQYAYVFIRSNTDDNVNNYENEKGKKKSTVPYLPEIFGHRDSSR